MDAGDIYRRLPGLTQEEAVALALVYHLGEADAYAARAASPADASALPASMPGAGHDMGRGLVRGLLGTLGTLGGTVDAGAVARLVEWYAAGWDDVAADDNKPRPTAIIGWRSPLDPYVVKIIRAICHLVYL